MHLELGPFTFTASLPKALSRKISQGPMNASNPFCSRSISRHSLPPYVRSMFPLSTSLHWYLLYEEPSPKRYERWNNTDCSLRSFYRVSLEMSQNLDFLFRRITKTWMNWICRIYIEVVKVSSHLFSLDNDERGSSSKVKWKLWIILPLPCKKWSLCSLVVHTQLVTTGMSNLQALYQKEPSNKGHNYQRGRNFDVVLKRQAQNCS